MTLTNLMEKKQLNFDQPLLSVRRCSLAGSSSEMYKKKTDNYKPQVSALPYYISDLKSGPVSNPGAVPFQWEQTPGRPKDERKDERETTGQLHHAPRLPPGRIVNHKNILKDIAQRGLPASSSRSHSENTFLCSPGSEFGGFVEGKKFQNISSSDDENVIFEDARDTLSQGESFFYNCSMSGVSGLDGPNMDPSGSLLDPQTRDFMMGRFLPAAKAVASEIPQFASWKHPVAREQSRQVTNVVTKQSPIDYNVPSTSPHNVHKELEAEEEEDDDVDDFDDTKDLAAKLCGLLPRFCLLNPIPGMRDQAHLISSVQSARVRPPYGGMRTKTVNKDKRHNNLGDVKRITYLHNSSLSFLREREFHGLSWEPKDSKGAKLDPKFMALLADHSVEELMSPVNSASEKTLYIDYKSKIDSRDSNLSSFGSRGIHPSDGYSRKDMKLPLGPEQGSLAQTENSNIVDVSSSENRSQNDGKDILQVPSKDQSVGLVLNTILSKKSHVEASNKKSGPSLALAPFLPKSPSESWLSRTLPSMSTKQSSSKLYSGNVALKTSHLNNTRDRILKTSNVQHLLLPPTGELATISEN